MACALVLACAAGPLGCQDDPLEQVRALQAQDRHVESLELLETLLEQRPDDPEVHYLYGVTSVQTGRASLGIWSLRRAREFDGWEIRAGVELARAGVDTGDNATSIEAATRVLELEPDHRPALDIRAEAFVRDGDYEAALADVTRLQEIDPDDGDVELLMLRTLIGQGRIDEAEALFTELEARRTDGELELPAARYCTARAIFAAERGEIDLAGQTFDACLESHPADPLVLESALKFFDAQGDPERSRALLERALEQAPEVPQIRQSLARRLRATGHSGEAERVLLEGTELEPATLAATSWGALGVHYFELADFAAAADAWSHLLELVPQPGGEVMLAYGEALALAGQHERALEIAEKLPDAQRHVLRGRVLLEQRDADPALEAFDAAIRLWPDNAVAHYYAARAAEHAGKFERAISEYRASVRTDPEATDAGLRLGRLHIAEGRYEPARIALSHHLRGQPTDADALVIYYRVNRRLGQRSPANQTLLRLAQVPGERGRALAEAARTLAATQGDGAAADLLLRESEGVEWSAEAPALRALVDHLARAGRSAEALSRAKSALDAAPDSAVLHEIYAVALEHSGSPPAAILASHQRSLELDPNHAPSWRARARLLANEGDVQGAAEACGRAQSTSTRESPEAAEIGVECARLLIGFERVEAARQLLEELLWQHPIDGRVAAMLSTRPIALDPSSDRALELARHARRFGAAPLERVAPLGRVAPLERVAQ